MRPITDREKKLYESGHYRIEEKILIESENESFVNVVNYLGHNWVKDYKYDYDIDTTVAQLQLTLHKHKYYDSLNPYISKTRVNIDENGNFSPRIDEGRKVIVSIAFTAVDMRAKDEHYFETFSGTVQNISNEDESIELTIDDLSADLRDCFFIEEEQTIGAITKAASSASQYSAYVEVLSVEGFSIGDTIVLEIDEVQHQKTITNISGTKIYVDPILSEAITYDENEPIWIKKAILAENVIQELLNRSSSEIILNYSESSSFYIVSYKQQKETLLKAIETIVENFGWKVRYLYYENEWKFTLYDPRKTKENLDYFFSRYFKVTKFESGLEGIRNKIVVNYGDKDDRKPKTVIDQDSIDRYKTRFLEITEASTGQIDTEEEAEALGNAALNDLSSKPVNFEIPVPYFPWAEIGDFFGFRADEVNYDTDQELYVVGVEQSKSENRTIFSVRTKPSGAYLDWFRREAGKGMAPTRAAVNVPSNVGYSTGLETKNGNEVAYIDLSWNKNIDNVNYYEVSYKSDGKWTEYTSVQENIRIPFLETNTTYEVRMRACKTVNDSVSKSDWTSSLYIDTPIGTKLPAQVIVEFPYIDETDTYLEELLEDDPRLENIEMDPPGYEIIRTLKLEKIDGTVDVAKIVFEEGRSLDDAFNLIGEFGGNVPEFISQAELIAQIQGAVSVIGLALEQVIADVDINNEEGSIKLFVDQAYTDLKENYIDANSAAINITRQGIESIVGSRSLQLVDANGDYIDWLSLQENSADLSELSENDPLLQGVIIEDVHSIINQQSDRISQAIIDIDGNRTLIDQASEYISQIVADVEGNASEIILQKNSIEILTQDILDNKAYLEVLPRMIAMQVSNAEAGIYSRFEITDEAISSTVGMKINKIPNWDNLLEDSDELSELDEESEDLKGISLESPFSLINQQHNKITQLIQLNDENYSLIQQALDEINFRVTSDEYTAGIDMLIGGVDAIAGDLQNSISAVEQQTAKIRLSVESVEGNYSALELRTGELETQVQTEDIVSRINQSAEEIIFNADKVRFGKSMVVNENGEAIFNGGYGFVIDSITGRVDVGGLSADSIIAGTLDANNVDIVNLTAENIKNKYLEGVKVKTLSEDGDYSELDAGSLKFYKNGYEDKPFNYVRRVAYGSSKSGDYVNLTTGAGAIVSYGLNGVPWNSQPYILVSLQEVISYAAEYPESTQVYNCKAVDVTNAGFKAIGEITLKGVKQVSQTVEQSIATNYYGSDVNLLEVVINSSEYSSPSTRLYTIQYQLEGDSIWYTEFTLSIPANKYDSVTKLYRLENYITEREVIPTSERIRYRITVSGISCKCKFTPSRTEKIQDGDGILNWMAIL